MSLVFDRVASTTTPLDSTAPAAQLHWELVFDGVWLARDHGRFAGMVQGVQGDSMKLTDAHGNLCGLYATFDDAQRALVERAN
jgi:hypothetical protein